MLLEVADLLALAGAGGERFASFVHDLVRAECRTHRIAPADVDWDFRVSCPDGGCDVFIAKGHGDGHPRFIPNKPSMWSIKSGKDGIEASTLRREVTDAAHKRLQEHLIAGNVYVWCALELASQPRRNSMRQEADALATELGFQSDQIEFRWIDALKDVLEDHPNLIAKHLPLTVSRLTGVGRLEDAAKQDRRGFGVPWVEFAGRASLKERIQQHLLSTADATVLHIAGLSGIGKTRTVVEACLGLPELQDTLYVQQYAHITEEFLRYLERPGRSTRVVIDEVSLTDYQRLADRFHTLGDRLRVVTIGPARRGERDRASDPSLMVLREPETEDGVLRIVTEAGAGLSEPVLRSIAEVSGHDLRLALLLVFATSASPALRQVPVSDHRDIWDRVVSLFSREIRDPSNFEENYQVLTVAVDVGRSDGHRKEIEYLGEHFQKNCVDLDRAVDLADKCGLGVKTPLFFESGPRALAVWVFRDQLWGILEPTVEAFLKGMPSDRLRRRFIERCHELQGHEREEVLNRVGAFFLKSLGKPAIAKLADREASRVFQAWAELDPNRGLGWLRAAVDSSSDDDLIHLNGALDGSGGWRGRRQVVWLCEHLACFGDHFWDCEHILFRLAQVETEQSIGNNSTNTWRDMFRPVLSNTEVPFEPRWQHLLKRLLRADKGSFNLVLSAALDALEGHVSKIAPPTVVGGRVVPDEWRPGTTAELWALRKDAGSRLLDRIAILPPDRRRKSIMAAIDKLGRIVHLGLCTELKKATTALASDPQILRRLRSALDEVISGAERMAAESKQDASTSPLLRDLKAWRSELEPESLRDEVVDLTSRDYWSVYRNTARDKPVDEPTEVYEDIARRALQTPQVIEELSEWLTSDECKSGGMLALVLGREDKEDALRALAIEWFQARHAPEFTTQYLVGLSERSGGMPADVAALLDSAVSTAPGEVARTTASADVSASGYARLLKCVDKLNSDERGVIGQLRFGRWAELLDAKQKCVLLDKLDTLAHRGDPRSLSIAFELLRGWSNYGKSGINDEIATKAIDLLRSAQLLDVQVDDHAWKIAAELLVESYPGSVAEILADVITDVESRRHQRREYAQESFKELAANHPAEAMAAIGRWVLDEKRGLIFRMWDFKGLFDAVGLDAVRCWIRQAGELAAVRVARHLDGPRLDDDGNPVIPSLADWLLTEFGDVQEVFHHFCMGRHSGEARWGLARDHRKEIERLTAPFLGHEKKWVRDWARYERQLLAAEIELDDRWEDELDRT